MKQKKCNTIKQHSHWNSSTMILGDHEPHLHLVMNHKDRLENADERAVK